MATLWIYLYFNAQYKSWNARQFGCLYMFFKVLHFSCIRTNIVETVVPYQQAFVINSYNVFVELYVIPNSHKQKQATFIHLGSEMVNYGLIFTVSLLLVTLICPCQLSWYICNNAFWWSPMNSSIHHYLSCSVIIVCVCTNSPWNFVWWFL